VSFRAPDHHADGPRFKQPPKPFFALPQGPLGKHPVAYVAIIDHDARDLREVSQVGGHRFHDAPGSVLVEEAEFNADKFARRLEKLLERLLNPPQILRVNIVKHSLSLEFPGFISESPLARRGPLFHEPPGGVQECDELRRVLDEGLKSPFSCCDESLGILPLAQRLPGRTGLILV
jgi:hypothetical protein